MKYIISLFLLCLPFWVANAQEQIEMAMAVPSSQVEISHNTCKVLCNKILSAMSRNGVSSVEYSCIVLQPEVTYSNSNIAEGGVRTIHTYDIQLNIAVRHLITGTEYCNVVIPLRGSGIKPDNAVLQAVNTLKEDDKMIDAFISDAKRKIVDYYRKNTNNIINYCCPLKLKWALIIVRDADK